KAERVPAYRLLGVRDPDDAIARRRESPLIGRENESRLLRDAFELACGDRRCQTITLVGPAGMGKSRLTEEFARFARESATVLRGRCLAYGDGITFWPLTEVVRQAAGLDHSDQAESAREKLAALAGPDDDVLARIASMVGLSPEQFPVQELFWATRKLFEQLARERPLVVVFEDLHWAEPTFLDLVEHVGKTVEDAAVLVLCNARPDLLEMRPEWGDAPNATHVVLEALGARDSERVIDNLLGDAGLDDDVRALAPEPIRERVVAHLQSLGHKQLVRPEPSERSFEEPWRFDHALIRDTTYEALLKRTRAKLHEQFVRWADVVNGDRALEYEE